MKHSTEANHHTANNRNQQNHAKEAYFAVFKGNNSTNNYNHNDNRFNNLNTNSAPPLAISNHATSATTVNAPIMAAPESDLDFSAWQSMTRTLAHYERLEQIGEGTYGQVYRARCKDSGRIVAMKKMRIHHGGYWGMPLQLIREIKILKRLHHPRLLRMIEVVTSKGVEHLDQDDPPQKPPSSKEDQNTDKAADAREAYKGNLFLVLEYVEHDLTGLLDVAYQFQEVQIKCIFKQLLQALAFMHENKYVHRDIKSSNILLDSCFGLKLADFGLARCIEPSILEQMQMNNNNAINSTTSSNDLTNKVITLWYRPPEILLGSCQYGPAVDVWSAGCILAELLLGKPLFPGKLELETLNLVIDLLGTPNEETWEFFAGMKKSKPGHSQSAAPIDLPSFRRDTPVLQSRLREKYGSKVSGPALNLLEKLLEWDPRKRLTAANALGHSYFWKAPAAPDDPAMLGRLEVGPTGHFHEFQTKKKRKEAKAVAEQAREKVRRKGGTKDEADEEYDKIYLGIMKKVAQDGIAVPTKEGTDQKHNSRGRSEQDRTDRYNDEGGRKDSKERSRSKSENRSRRDSEDRRRRDDRRDRDDRGDDRDRKSRSRRDDEYSSSRRSDDRVDYEARSGSRDPDESRRSKDREDRGRKDDRRRSRSDRDDRRSQDERGGRDRDRDRRHRDESSSSKRRSREDESRSRKRRSRDTEPEETNVPSETVAKDSNSEVPKPAEKEKNPKGQEDGKNLSQASESVVSTATGEIESKEAEEVATQKEAGEMGKKKEAKESSSSKEKSKDERRNSDGKEHGRRSRDESRREKSRKDDRSRKDKDRHRSRSERERDREHRRGRDDQYRSRSRREEGRRRSRSPARDERDFRDGPPYGHYGEGPGDMNGFPGGPPPRGGDYAMHPNDVYGNMGPRDGPGFDRGGNFKRDDNGGNRDRRDRPGDRNRGPFPPDDGYGPPPQHRDNRGGPHDLGPPPRGEVGRYGPMDTMGGGRPHPDDRDYHNRPRREDGRRGGGGDGRDRDRPHRPPSRGGDYGRR